MMTKIGGETSEVDPVPEQDTEATVLLTPPINENNPINSSHMHTEPTNSRRPASTRERKKPVWQKDYLMP
nr:hypothetical protein BgiMline_004421 [Biomphalaria glabrata]